MLKDQLRRRTGLEFTVTREDDTPGDLGAVLVLTRPPQSKKRLLDDEIEGCEGTSGADERARKKQAIMRTEELADEEVSGEGEDVEGGEEDEEYDEEYDEDSCPEPGYITGCDYEGGHDEGDDDEGFDEQGFNRKGYDRNGTHKIVCLGMAFMDGRMFSLPEHFFIPFP
jgi:hypothetical protein